MTSKLLLLRYLFCLLLAWATLGCGDQKSANKNVREDTTVIDVDDKTTIVALLSDLPKDISIPEGMVWVPGSVFEQGAVAQDKMAMGHEKPTFKVAVDGFFIVLHKTLCIQRSVWIKSSKQAVGFFFTNITYCKFFGAIGVKFFIP